MTAIFSRWLPLETPSGFAILSPDLEATVLAARWVYAMRDLVESGVSREDAEKRLRAIRSERLASNPNPNRGTWMGRRSQAVPEDLERATRELTSANGE